MVGECKEEDDLRDASFTVIDGLWVNNEGEIMAEIRGLSIDWYDGPRVELRRLGARQIACTLFDEEYRAQIGDDDRLRWNDGDIWVRPGNGHVHVLTATSDAGAGALSAKALDVQPQSPSSRTVDMVDTIAADCDFAIAHAGFSHDQADAVVAAASPLPVRQVVGAKPNSEKEISNTFASPRCSTMQAQHAMVPAESLHTVSAKREPKVAMRVGKKVKIIGAGPFQGHFGIVVGFDEDGDPELRLDDGDVKVFYRRDVSVLNEVRRRPSAVAEPLAPGIDDEGRVAGSSSSSSSSSSAGIVGAVAAAPQTGRLKANKADPSGGGCNGGVGSCLSSAAVPEPSGPPHPLRPPESALATARSVAAAARSSNSATVSGPGISFSKSGSSAQSQAQDAEDPTKVTVKVSLPDELRIAKLKLAKLSGCGRREASAALRVGEVQLLLGHRGEAEECARSAIALFASVGEPEGGIGHARATRLLTLSLVADESLHDAAECCRMRLDSCNIIGDKQAETIARLAFVEVHLANERHREALREATSALRAAQVIPNRRLSAAAWQAMSAAHLRMSGSAAVKGAMDCASEALSISQELADQKEEASAMLLLSKVHSSKEEFEEAYHMAEQAAAIARKSGCKRAEATAQREVASILVSARIEIDLAVQAAEEAVRLSEEIFDPFGEIACRQVAINTYILSGRLSDALEFGEAALALARDLRHRRLVKEAVDLLVQLRAQEEGQMDEAIKVAQEELELAKEDGDDPRREFSAVQRLVSLHITLDDLDEARKAAEAAVELKRFGDRKVEGWALQLLAEVHLAAKRYADALHALSQALSLLQGERDVRSVSNILQITFDAHVENGNDTEAIRSRHALRLAYQAAGWKDEEGTVLLQLAELILQVRGPREAAKIARDAVEIFKELEDKSGEASGMLVTAHCQVASKASTDALKSTVIARKLFKSLNDAAGEAQSLLAAAEVYTRNGAADEAVRVIREAQKICQDGRESKVELECLQMIASIRLRVLQKEEEAGRKPKADFINDAVSATKELVNLLDTFGDSEDQRAGCLAQLSTLLILNEDFEEGLKVAQEALEFAVRLDRPEPMGQALMSMSEAHANLGNQKDAVQAAEDAVSLFEQLSDQSMMETAKQVLETAKSPHQRPKAKGECMPGESSKRSKSGQQSHQFVPREMDQSLSQHLGRGPQHPHQHRSQEQCAVGPSASRRPNFSSAMAMEAERSPTIPLRPPSPIRSEPNQERRRQQLLAAMEARAMRFPEQESPTHGQLRRVLHSVRPDWNSSELGLVMEKFAAIDVDTDQELFRQLNSLGSRGFNQRLKDNGRRPLKKETLDALRAYGDRFVSEALQAL